MTDRSNTEALAAAFREHLPPDTRFLFALIERSGSVTTMWTIKDLGARVEFLERLLEHAEEDERKKGA